VWDRQNIRCPFDLATRFHKIEEPRVLEHSRSIIVEPCHLTGLFIHIYIIYSNHVYIGEKVVDIRIQPPSHVMDIYATPLIPVVHHGKCDQGEIILLMVFKPYE
jgi:hypothetical protein